MKLNKFKNIIGTVILHSKYYSHNNSNFVDI